MNPISNPIGSAAPTPWKAPASLPAAPGYADVFLPGPPSTPEYYPRPIILPSPEHPVQPSWLPHPQVCPQPVWLPTTPVLPTFPKPLMAPPVICQTSNFNQMA